MADDITVAIIGVGGVVAAGVIGIVGTLLGQWLAGQTAKEIATLEQAKYAQERLWDARQKTYAEILAHMRDIALASDLLWNGFVGVPYDEPFEFGDRHTELENRINDRLASISSIYDINRLMISNHFAGLVEGVSIQHFNICQEDDAARRAMLWIELAKPSYEEMLEQASREISGETGSRHNFDI